MPALCFRCEEIVSLKTIHVPIHFRDDQGKVVATTEAYFCGGCVNAILREEVETITRRNMESTYHLTEKET